MLDCYDGMFESFGIVFDMLSKLKEIIVLLIEVMQCAGSRERIRSTAIVLPSGDHGLAFSHR